MKRAWSRSLASVGIVALTGAMLGVSLIALEAQGRPPSAGPVDGPERDVWISIHPAQSVVELGQAVTLGVVIEDAPEISGYDFEMAWNPAMFSVSAVAKGDFMGTAAAQLVEIDNHAGTLAVAHFFAPPIPHQLPSGDGTLAAVTLQATGVGTTTLHLSATNVFTRNGGQIRISDPGSGTAESICDTAQIAELRADSPVEQGAMVRFRATVTGAQPITYTWDPGDGSSERVHAGLHTLVHTYAVTGTYTATLTVDNVCRVEDSATTTVTVSVMGEPPRIFVPVVLKQGG